jgi:hypothetical protein
MSTLRAAVVATAVGVFAAGVMPPVGSQQRCLKDEPPEDLRRWSASSTSSLELGPARSSNKILYSSNDSTSAQVSDQPVWFGG